MKTTIKIPKLSKIEEIEQDLNFLRRWQRLLKLEKINNDTTIN